MNTTLQVNRPIAFQKSISSPQNNFNSIAFKCQPQQDSFQKSTVQNTASNISFNGLLSFLKKDPIEQMYKKNEGLQETVAKVMTGDDKAIKEFNEFIDNDTSKKKVRGKLFSKVIKDLKKDILSGENVVQASEALVKLDGVKALTRQMLMSGAMFDIHKGLGLDGAMMFPSIKQEDYDNKKFTPLLLKTLFSEANPLHKEAREQYDTQIKDYMLKPKITGLLIYDATLKEQAVKQFTKNVSSVQDIETVMEFVKGPDKIYGSVPNIEIGFITDDCDITELKRDAIQALPDILDKTNAGKGVRAEVKEELKDIIASDPHKDVKLACYEVLEKI